jgi:hypothetical protein
MVANCDKGGVDMSEDSNKDGITVSTLARRANESEAAHRALLLFAMQTPTQRNKRATARAVGKSNSTLHGWVNKYGWGDRIVGQTIDAEAQQLYRRLYFDRVGMQEIAMVEDNIVSPISVVGNTPRPVADTILRTIEATKAPKKSTVFEEEVKRKHLALIDAGIGYIAQGLKAGDIRRSLRDLPLLMTLRKEIISAGKENKGDGIAMIESARMRYAKSTGGDIVCAMHEDAQELCAILGALAEKSDIPTYSQIQPIEAT